MQPSSSSNSSVSLSQKAIQTSTTSEDEDSIIGNITSSPRALLRHLRVSVSHLERLVSHRLILNQKFQRYLFPDDDSSKEEATTTTMANPKTTDERFSSSEVLRVCITLLKNARIAASVAEKDILTTEFLAELLRKRQLTSRLRAACALGRTRNSLREFASVLKEINLSFRREILGELKKEICLGEFVQETYRSKVALSGERNGSCLLRFCCVRIEIWCRRKWALSQEMEDVQVCVLRSRLLILLRRLMLKRGGFESCWTIQREERDLEIWEFVAVFPEPLDGVHFALDVQLKTLQKSRIWYPRGFPLESLRDLSSSTSSQSSFVHRGLRANIAVHFGDLTPSDASQMPKRVNEDGIAVTIPRVSYMGSVVEMTSHLLQLLLPMSQGEEEEEEDSEEMILKSLAGVIVLTDRVWTAVKRSRNLTDDFLESVLVRDIGTLARDPSQMALLLLPRELAARMSLAVFNQQLLVQRRQEQQEKKPLSTALIDSLSAPSSQGGRLQLSSPLKRRLLRVRDFAKVVGEIEKQSLMATLVRSQRKISLSEAKSMLAQWKCRMTKSRIRSVRLQRRILQEKLNRLKALIAARKKRRIDGHSRNQHLNPLGRALSNPNRTVALLVGVWGRHISLSSTFRKLDVFYPLLSDEVRVSINELFAEHKGTLHGVLSDQILGVWRYHAIHCDCPVLPAIRAAFSLQDLFRTHLRRQMYDAKQYPEIKMVCFVASVTPSELEASRQRGKGNLMVGRTAGGRGGRRGIREQEQEQKRGMEDNSIIEDRLLDALFEVSSEMPQMSVIGRAGVWVFSEDVVVEEGALDAESRMSLEIERLPCSVSLRGSVRQVFRCIKVEDNED